MAEEENAPPVRVCESGSIRIEGLWVTPTAAGGTGGLYGTIRLETEEGDSLVEVLSDAAERVELHEMTAEGERMKMVRMSGRPGFRKGRPLILAPGGKHGMLINLKRELRRGDSLEIGFRTGRGDTVRCVALVSASSPAAGQSGNGAGGNGAGAKLYAQYCSACHGADGEGQSGIFPPLAGSDFYKEKNRTIDAVVNGLQGEITVKGVTYNGIMPPLPDSYDDEIVASVINYVVERFGEKAWQTTPEEVAGIRKRD